MNPKGGHQRVRRKYKLCCLENEMLIYCEKKGLIHSLRRLSISVTVSPTYIICSIS
jgi:hypothetical protein